MKSAKEQVESLISDIEAGIIEPYKSWELIKSFKSQYVAEINEQSWHKYIGDKFQKVIHSIIKGYIKRLKNVNPKFTGLDILT